MLPEIGATELLVIAAVALIVVGPKDLPVMMRKLGQFMARMRAMASEFRTSFEDMARQSELDDLRKEVEAMRQARYFDTPLTQDELADVEADQVFADIHQDLTGPQTPVAAPEPQSAPAKPKAKRKPRARKTPEAGA